MNTATPMTSFSSPLASASSARNRTASRFAWAVLIYMLGVILWGAYVRASGSGAGCGNHWPLCNGEVLPTSPKTEMIIEFTHRVTSGLSVLSVIALLVLTWRATTRGAWARKSAVLAMLFMLNEALLGALLVLLQHVGRDASIARAVFLSLHLANTLLLIASIALTAYWLPSSRAGQHYHGREAGWVTAGLLITLMIGVTGALAALGDTLFPATSLRGSIAQDFASGSFYLLRLRLLHPILAVSGALLVTWMSIKALLSRSPVLRNFSIAMIVLAVLQLSLGILNVLLLAPVWLQLTHLLVADLFWIVLVLLCDEMLSVREVSAVEPQLHGEAAQGV